MAMNCRKTEKWFLRSLDGRLDEVRRKTLDAHFQKCPACAAKRREYRILLGILRGEAEAFEPLPRFWERLDARIARTQPPNLLVVWEKWCLRAVPVIMGLALIIVAGFLFLLRPAREPATRSGLLLFNEQNAVSGAHAVLNEDQEGALPLQLIFASADEGNAGKRSLP
jgi:anti-sigma factor RsiW